MTKPSETKYSVPHALFKGKPASLSRREPGRRAGGEAARFPQAASLRRPLAAARPLQPRAWDTKARRPQQPPLCLAAGLSQHGLRLPPSSPGPPGGVPDALQRQRTQRLCSTTSSFLAVSGSPLPRRGLNRHRAP